MSFPFFFLLDVMIYWICAILFFLSIKNPNWRLQIKNHRSFVESIHLRIATMASKTAAAKDIITLCTDLPPQRVLLLCCQQVRETTNRFQFLGLSEVKNEIEFDIVVCVYRVYCTIEQYTQRKALWKWRSMGFPCCLPMMN